MKKTLLTLTLAFAAGLLLTSCASGMEPSATTKPTSSPTTMVTASPSTQPDATLDNGMTDSLGLVPDASESPAAQGVTSISDARKAVETIEDELEKLSEVEDAQVVLIGNTAAVALEFDDQYQGGIDERLREIVQERVDGVVKGVTVVEITDDAMLMDELEQLGDRMETATDMENLRSELDMIIRRITGNQPA